MEAIKTVGLTKKYKNLTAVDGLDLSVERGELFSLLGVNGAGKTTTIKMLSCLTKPTGGDAFLLGRSIARDAAEVKNIIGVSPQETAVAPGLTVKENLTLMCGVHGFSREKRQRKLEELTERFDLTEVLGRKAGKLSGGWQRRLSIAMALISEPEILFLDEPTLGLDVLARSDLWDIIRISGVHNGFVMNTLFFCLDTGLASFEPAFLCQFGDVLHRNALAGIGGVGFILRGFGDVDIAHETVENGDLLGAVLPGSLRFVDINMINQLPQQRRSQRFHLHELPNGSEKMVFILLHGIQRGDFLSGFRDFLLQFHPFQFVLMG